jgi:hypothetical protein
MIIFELILIIFDTSTPLFEAAVALVKIALSLRPNHHQQIRPSQGCPKL